MNKYKSQPRIKGVTRNPRHTSLKKEIDIAVLVASREFRVSKSWVIAVALADFFKIKNIERFDR